MDFLLSTSGDLVLEEQSRNTQFKLAYRVSEANGFTLRFHVLNEKEDLENKGLRVTFNTGNKSVLRHHSKVINDVEEKIQRIRMELMTELAQLPRRKNFGSELVKYRHTDIHRSQNLEAIREAALKVASKVLNNPLVQVVPTKGIGNLYFHNIQLSIYEDNVKIFDFII